MNRARVRPLQSAFEVLETRLTPATATVQAGTLTIIGDASANNITVTADSNDATKFTVAGATGNSPFTGIKYIVAKLGDGKDTFTFTGSPGKQLAGTLTINGGNGDNTVNISDALFAKNVSITNGTGKDSLIIVNSTLSGDLTVANGTGDSYTYIHGTSAILGSVKITNGTGNDNLYLWDTNVGRNVTITNGTGNSHTEIRCTSPGQSAINGALAITNGTGSDSTVIADYNVGGNVTINNGHGDGNGFAGAAEIFNAQNTSALSLIKGNVSVSFLDGDAGLDSIWDTEVLGNVSFNYGPGTASLAFDGHGVAAPARIDGNLTVKATGTLILRVGDGAAPGDQKTGLIIGKNLSVTSGNGNDNVTFNKLQVVGMTTLGLGNGANTVAIDDSLFVNTFKLTTGFGNDTVNIENTLASSGPTIFNRPVTLNLGAGADTDAVTLMGTTGTTDSTQQLLLGATFAIHSGIGGAFSLVQDLTHELFPFGGSVVSGV